MIDLTNNSASINKTVPLDKLFDDETIDLYGISAVSWLMTIKPGIRNVQKHVEGRKRYEEIEVLSIELQELPESGFHLRLLKQVHSKISYPCVLFFQYKDKYKISAWNFEDSVSGASRNILRGGYISSWIKEPIYSKKLNNSIEGIQNLLLQGEGDIEELYNQICQYIVACSPQYVGSRTHLQRIVYAMTGEKNDPVIKTIDSTKRYTVKNSPGRYQRREYYDSYKYVYEYEEIWHGLMSDERIKSIIEKRRYSDVEDMIMRIDMQYEEQREKW